jgi:hypothetical protein
MVGEHRPIVASGAPARAQVDTLLYRLKNRYFRHGLLARWRRESVRARVGGSAGGTAQDCQWTRTDLKFLDGSRARLRTTHADRCSASVRLLRDKGFTVSEVLTIAVCIAANIATFARVNPVLLRPPPISDARPQIAVTMLPHTNALARTPVAAADYRPISHAVSFHRPRPPAISARTR